MVPGSPGAHLLFCKVQIVKPLPSKLGTGWQSVLVANVSQVWGTQDVVVPD